MGKKESRTKFPTIPEREMDYVNPDGPIDDDGLQSGLSLKEKLGPDHGGVVQSAVLVNGDKMFPTPDKTGNDAGSVF